MLIYLCSNSGSLPGNLHSGSTARHIHLWQSHAAQVNTSQRLTQLRTGSNASALPPPGSPHPSAASSCGTNPATQREKTRRRLPAERPGAGRGDAAGGSGSRPQARPPGARPGRARPPPSQDPLPSPWPCRPPVSASAPPPPRPCGGQAGAPETATGPSPHPSLLQLSHRTGHRSFSHGRPKAFSPPASLHRQPRGGGSQRWPIRDERLAHPPREGRILSGNWRE